MPLFLYLNLSPIVASLDCGMTFFLFSYLQWLLLWIQTQLIPNTSYLRVEHVSSIENVSQNNDGPTQQEQEDTFSVLGRSCFTTGSHYWEAEVNVGTEVDLEPDGTGCLLRYSEERGGL